MLRHAALASAASLTALAALSVPGAARAGVELHEFGPDDAPQAVTTYRRARQALRDDPGEAYRKARSLPEFETVDDLRLELLARSSMASGHPAVARRALGALRDETDDGPLAFWAGLALGELRLLGSELDAAARIADRLDERADGLDLRDAERRYYRSRLVRLRHDIAVARGDTESAEEHALRLATKYPSTDAATRPGRTDTGPLTDARRFRRAKNLYGAWSYREAREEFRKLLGHPRYDDNARWYLGHIALDKLGDDPAEGREMFSGLTEDSPYASEALYQKARSYMVQENYGEALNVLDTYESRFPTGRRIEEVYYYRGWLPYDHRNNRRALDGFDAYIDRYGTSGARSSYVHGFRSWTYMRMGKWQKAVGSYDELEPFGNMLVWGKALYWQAYALRELGERDRALEKLDTLREAYPVTYYGVLGEQLRAKINGNDPRASEVWWPEGGGKADDSPRLEVQDYDHDLGHDARGTWRRVRALVALDERERARDELEAIYDEMLEGIDPDERDAWIHAMGIYVGDFHRMWVESTGGTISAMPEPPNPSNLEAAMAYPRAYRDVVQDVAGEFDLPAYLIWSIMRQESRYSPARISHADAVGALQMIPETARKVAEDLGTTYNPRTFYKPEVGFRFSGFYMRKLLETFDGHYVPMAAAYNSGPDVIADWYETNPDVSFPWLIEEFEYNEGRNYCRKVAEHMVRYLYLYEPDPERRGEILNVLFPLDRDISIPDDVGY